MSFRYELACKGFSTETAQHPVTYQKQEAQLPLSFKLSFLQYTG